MSPARTILLAALVAASLAAGAAAEEADDPLSDDALFGGEEALVTKNDGDAADGASSLLVSESVKVGGTFTFTIESESDPDAWGERGGDSFTPTTELGVDVFADARPSEDFRVFVKGVLDYPFHGESDMAIKEAFADLIPAAGVYVRAGKQTANWGVGYFFSPANLLNLERVDPENPEAELTGPLAVKAQVPVGTSNYYGYLLIRETEAGETFAFAPKLERVFGSTELSLGGIYEEDAPWAAMASATGKLGGFDLFVEGVLRGNEDKVFLVEDSGSTAGVSTETHSRELFPQATVGFSWSWDDDEGRLGISLRGQYYYNGLGYADSSVVADRRDVAAALLASGALTPEDLAERDRHYAAASLGFSDIMDSEIGVSFFWLGNLGDRSGRASATVTWDGPEHLKLSAAYERSYGAEGSEYASGGPASAVVLKLAVTEATF
jgi:hypothetical protein